jgi:hypothetical protein
MQVSKVYMLLQKFRRPETGFVVVKTTVSNVGYAACVHCNAYSRASGTHTGKTIFCLSIPLWSSLRGAYTLYHVNIKNKYILQLRTSLLNEKSQIRQARSSKVTGIGLKSVNM